jgi:hypothetical protein
VDEDPPDSARSMLQVNAANLRMVLDPARPKPTTSSLLNTQPPGYRLRPGQARARPNTTDLRVGEVVVVAGAGGGRRVPTGREAGTRTIA